MLKFYLFINLFKQQIVFFNTIPLESKLLGILKVSNLDENLHIARLSDMMQNMLFCMSGMHT